MVVGFHPFRTPLLLGFGLPSCKDGSGLNCDCCSSEYGCSEYAVVVCFHPFGAIILVSPCCEDNGATKCGGCNCCGSCGCEEDAVVDGVHLFGAAECDDPVIPVSGPAPTILLLRILIAAIAAFTSLVGGMIDIRDGLSELL